VVDAICKEIELKKLYLSDHDLRSIYFGGGTPSLLTVQELEQIFTAIDKNFSRKQDIEITLEANPDDLNTKLLDDLKHCGINRLSIGLQSFNDEELKWMNRAHNAKESEACVKMAQDKGFENITIDLIYGSKFQTLKSWENTLRKAVQLNTKHISSYNLTIEKKTTLGSKHHKGLEPSVNEDLSSKQFLMMIEILKEKDFIHYEISNFGKENFFAVHNSNYWLGHQYIGVGPSAHSYNGNERQWNIKNNQLYVDKINKEEIFYETEILSPKNKFNEYVLTRLRTIRGCDIIEMEKLFGKENVLRFVKKINSKKQFVIEKKGIYTLNDSGKLYSDGIAADLFI